MIRISLAFVVMGTKRGPKGTSDSRTPCQTTPTIRRDAASVVAGYGRTRVGFCMDEQGHCDFPGATSWTCVSPSRETLNVNSSVGRRRERRTNLQRGIADVVVTVFDVRAKVCIVVSLRSTLLVAFRTLWARRSPGIYPIPRDTNHVVDPWRGRGTSSS